MSLLTKKSATAKRILRGQGFGGVASMFREKLTWRNRLDHWLQTNPWWLGKFIELRGNNIMSDGLRFSVDSPAITTAVKSNFFEGLI